jgi:hypothetical protein
MADSYECFACKKVFAGVDSDKCPSCGGKNGQRITPSRVKEGHEGGVYYNIDPKTGGRAKAKRKRK